MADLRAPLRVLDELLWVLRRHGLRIATSQAIDAARAVALVGFGSRDTLRETLATVLVTHPRERPRFEAGFEAYFARDPGAGRTLWERLATKGFAEPELETLRDLLAAFAEASAEGAELAALVGRGAELDRLLQLAGTARTLDGLQSPLQSGFFTHKLLAELGANRAPDQLAALRVRLVDALGEERAGLLVAALEAELRASADAVREHVRGVAEERTRERSEQGGGIDKALAALDPSEVEDVRRAVRGFVQRLRGGERVRRRRARRGRIDPHRTLRLAMRSGGAPFVLARRARKRDKPKLLVVCDVSESVKNVATFLLELAYLSQELFAGTRTFVFVSELAETTSLFDERSIDGALAHAWSGAVVPVTHNSNYGRALRAFERRVLPDVDRRTTVVIVGDGRTNYLETGEDVLDAIRARARALLWLCPEPRAGWAVGDSAMPRYAPRCTKVLEVRTARDLEDAARLLVTLR